MITFQTLASSSSGCCYVVSGGGARNPLMVDCGIPLSTIRRSLPFSITELGGVLISHKHLDHCQAATDLMMSAVHIWSSAGTREQLSTARNFRSYRHTTLLVDEWNDVGYWSVLPFAVEHDVDGALGFVIGSPNGERLLYMTDTGFSRQVFTGLNVIAIECNHSEAIIRANAESGAIDMGRFGRTSRTHMSIERLEAFLDACDLSTVREIHLLHLSDQNSHEAEFKTRIQRRYGKPVYVAPSMTVVGGVR